MTIRISKLAGQMGLTADAIRYYERIGLLPPAERTEAGYRLYHNGAAERLRFIKGARRLGLSLDEIRELLGVLDRGLCPCGHAEALVRRRIAQVEQEMEQLTDVRARLLRLADRLADECSTAPSGAWPRAEQFIQEGRG